MIKFENALTVIVGIENISFYESMKHHTTLGVGGKAKIFITPCNVEQIKQIVKTCEQYEEDYCVIGAGSKLLVKDGGINKVVICLTSKFSGITQTGENTLSVLSGTSLNALNKKCLNLGLSGLENTFLIPATVGGAIHNNAGAYNHAVGDAVKSVTLLENGKLKTYSKKQCRFGYRTSVFYNQPHYIILSAEFELTPCQQEVIKQKFIEILSSRVEKQPINKKTAGSTFKRDGDIIPAKIIDELGLKGVKIGGAIISEKHSGFIENFNNATATDVLNLIDFISQKVYNELEIKLTPEIIVLGED